MVLVEFQKDDSVVLKEYVNLKETVRINVFPILSKRVSKISGTYDKDTLCID
jgi:hypothetical protein